MLSASIKIDRLHEAELKATMLAIGREGKKVLGNATKDTLRDGKVQIQNAVAREITLKKRKISKSITTDKLGLTSGVFHIKSDRMEQLRSFSRPAQTRRGVTVQVRTGGRRELHKSAFLGRGIGNTPLVLRRRFGVKKKLIRTVMKGGVKTKRSVIAEPLEALPGPTVYGVVKGEPGLLRMLEHVLGDMHMKILDRSVRALLRRSRHG